MATLKKFDEWGEFVELSQRRNIFTHNDGIVSDQYVSICQREGWKFASPLKIGDTLPIDLEYFSRAQRILSKIGFMLTHTLWAKIFPKELDEMHKSINSQLYNCLEQKRWKTAAEIGSFALSEPMKKGAPEIDLRIRAINVAIALKFSDNEEQSLKTLSSYDWTASYRDFRLAILVLHDKFDEAITIMESIGRSGELINKTAYHTWPLFHKFRERVDFYETYERIYGEPYRSELPANVSGASVAIRVPESNDSSNIVGQPHTSIAAEEKVVKRNESRRANVDSKPKTGMRHSRESAALRPAWSTSRLH